MADSCIVPNSGSERLDSIYGKLADTIKEQGLNGFFFEVRNHRNKQYATSQLYRDIYNHPSLANLPSLERGRKAFDIYLEAYSDKFIDKYGDWINNPEDFQGRLTEKSGEPVVNMLIESQVSDNTSRALEKSLKFLEKTIKSLESKLVRLERREDDKQVAETKALIDKLKKTLENKEIQAGVTDYLSYVKNNQINYYLTEIASYQETGTDPSPDVINGMFHFLDLYTNPIRDLRTALKSSKELYSFYKSEAEPIMREILEDIEDIRAFAVESHEKRYEEVAQREFGLSKEKIKEMFKSVVGDITGIGRWFGISANVSDPVVRMITELVRNIHNTVERLVRPVRDNLLDAQTEYEASGGNVTDVYETDKEGNRTGYLISERNWSQYFSESEKVKLDLINKFEVKEYPDVLNKLKELPKDDPLKAYYNNAWNTYFKTYTINENGVTLPLINPEFNSKMSNPNFKKYYDRVLEVHEDSKRKLPAKYRNRRNYYLLPQIHKEIAETFREEGVKEGLKETKRRKLITIISRLEEETDFGDTSVDAQGREIKLVPIHYVKQIDPNNLTNDVSSMYTQFYQMAQNFRQTTDNIADIELIHRAMGERDVKKVGKGKASKSYALARDIIDTQLYGLRSTEMTWKIGNKNINVTKLIDSLGVKYPSIVNMFGNIPVTASGFFKSQIDTFVENVVGKYTTFESSQKANKEFLKSIPVVISEFGKRQKTSKLDLMLEYNNALDDTYSRYKKLNIDTKLGRMGTNDWTYITFLPVSYSTVAKLSLSIYMNYKNIDGEFLTKSEFNKKYKDSGKKWGDYKDTLYDAYEVQNGEFRVKEEYRTIIDQRFENKLKKRINILSDRIEGKLGSLDRAAIMRTPYGRAVMLHRGWMPQMFSQRFKPKQFHFGLEAEEEGFYLTALRTIKNLFDRTNTNIRFKLSSWDTLEDFEKENLRRFLADAGMFLAVLLISKALNDIADEDDEDMWFYEYMAYQSNRILLEQGAFYRGAEAFKLLQSPAAAVNQWERITSLSRMLHMFEEIESGSYEGMTRFEQGLIRNSLLKNIYEFRDPKTKNQYLKSQIL